MNPAPCLVSPDRGEPGATWTGWIAADLFSYGDTGTPISTTSGAIALTTVEMAVRLDIVTLWIGSRTLAVADRDHLRAWVASPFQPLAVDDVEFVLVDRQVCLRVDGTGPFALAAEAVRHLVEVV
jgi:hypothetical protein